MTEPIDFLVRWILLVVHWIVRLVHRLVCPTEVVAALSVVAARARCAAARIAAVVRLQAPCPGRSSGTTNSLPTTTVLHILAVLLAIPLIWHSVAMLVAARPALAADAAIRVDAGATAGRTDSRGESWSADTGFVGGAVVDRGAVAIAGTADPYIYQTEHYGMTHLRLAVPNGPYLVRLHFAETYWTQANQRVFDADVEGTPIAALDVLAQAGGPNRALVKELAVTVADGELTVAFTPRVNYPLINGIEVLPPAALRIDAGASASQTDSHGQPWSADTGFVGGTVVDRGSVQIAGTSDPFIYPTERYNLAGYRLAVPNGPYRVRLHFAETYWTQANQRVFDAAVEGTAVTGLDVVAEAGGPYRALVKEFAVNVADGELTLIFTPRVNYPLINGIEVLPGTQPPPPPPPPPPPTSQLLSPVGGGAYPDVVFDPSDPNVRYLCSDVAGILKTEDGGETWRFITKGLDHLIVVGLAVAPSDTRVLYAATSGGLYRSRDRGENWELTNTNGGKIAFVRPENHQTIAVSAADSRVLAVGTKSGEVFYSRDGGDTWVPLGGKERPFGNTAPAPITALRLIPDGTTLYASSTYGGVGVARYRFETGAWTLLTGGPSAAEDLFVSPRDPATVFVAGQPTLYVLRDRYSTWSWSRSADIRPIKGSGSRTTRVVQATDGHLAVVWEWGWSGGVMFSSDMGANWSDGDGVMHSDTVGNPARIAARPQGARVLTIAVSPTAPNVLFRTDWFGVWRTDDRGANWFEKIRGAANMVGSDIVITRNGWIYLATMDNGLMRSKDGGRTYEVLFPRVPYRREISGHVWRVVVSEESPCRIIATSSPWDDPVNQVVVSDDCGATFSVHRAGLPAQRPRVNTLWGQGYARALAVDPTNFNVVYLGIDGDDGGGLYVSRDGGRTWARSPGQPMSKRVYNGLSVDPTNPQRLFWATAGGGVERSEDGGRTWSRVAGEMGWVNDVVAARDGSVYAVGDVGRFGRVYVSRNHGAAGSWTLLFDATSFDRSDYRVRGAAVSLAVDPKDPATVAVSLDRCCGAAGGRVFLTRDSGAHWTDIGAGLPNGTGMAAVAFHPSAPELWGHRYAGGVWRTPT